MKGIVEVKMVVKGQIELEYYWKVGRKLLKKLKIIEINIFVGMIFNIDFTSWIEKNSKIFIFTG